MTLIASATIAEAEALAVTLRARMADLSEGSRDAAAWSQIAADALAAVTGLTTAVPAVRNMSHWTDAVATDTEERPELRAIAAVRSLDVRVRSARGRRVIALYRA